MQVNLIQLQNLSDVRGNLVSLESQKNVPFAIQRVYYLFGTKDNVRRGFHAHKRLQQLIVAVHGSCKFLLDDGRERVEVLLCNPSEGLLVQSNIWREMFDFSPDCVLMVLADAHYDEDDYIRDYSDFIKMTERGQQ